MSPIWNAKWINWNVIWINWIKLECEMDQKINMERAWNVNWINSGWICPINKPLTIGTRTVVQHVNSLTVSHAQIHAELDRGAIACLIVYEEFCVTDTND